MRLINITKFLVLGIFATLLFGTAPVDAKGRYAKINGLELYYEVHGKGGQPLVLLHGAFCTIDGCMSKLIKGLSKDRQVIALELQGHGHTADIDRPLAVASLADDTAKLLAQLKITSADVYGYSMGGAVALELALRNPKLVRKLVLAGAPLWRDGWHPGMIDGIKQIKAEEFKQTPWYQAYKKVAPKPEQWSALVEKVQGLDLINGGFKPETLKQITAPVMVVVGDSDVVRPEHAVEVFRIFGGGVAGDVVGLPKARLAILPGTTHVTLIDNGDIVATLVKPFLDAK